MSQIQQHRAFMKSAFGVLTTGSSDQSRGVAQPPVQLPYSSDARIISLPEVDVDVLKERDLYACMKSRRSRRRWTKDPLSLNQLSFLLWATQGVDKVMGDGYATLRPVPSGGARHPFETYVLAQNITGLELGVYRYLPLSHSLVFLFTEADLHEEVMTATFGQRFVANAPVTFFWSCIPYRGEWRYTVAAHKVMLLDAGHLCQNLYLAAEAIGAGTCAIGAYDQDAADKFLRLDGKDEFVVYLAPVGIPKE